jgi:hypothetical protein
LEFWGSQAAIGKWELTPEEIDATFDQTPSHCFVIMVCKSWLTSHTCIMPHDSTNHIASKSYLLRLEPKSVHMSDWSERAIQTNWKTHSGEAVH